MAAISGHPCLASSCCEHVGDRAREPQHPAAGKRIFVYGDKPANEVISLLMLEAGQRAIGYLGVIIPIPI